MDLPASRLHRVLADSRFNAAVAGITIIAFFGWVYGSLQPAGWPLFQFIWFLALAPFLATAIIYSIRVRQENRAFRAVPSILHRINHNYRDVLCRLFGAGAPRDLRARILIEREALVSVCQSIAELFSLLTRVPCTVTVKLITRETSGRVFCETAIRSQLGGERDQAPSQKFELMTGENSGLDAALKYRPGIISHFFSADLTREPGYRNERPNWAAHYQSAIVVPIRYLSWENRSDHPISDTIGFLAVDTLSTHRLNNTFHVDFLASFADQMYNFMSLMRGKYSLPARRTRHGNRVPNDERR